MVRGMNTLNIPAVLAQCEASRQLPKPQFKNFRWANVAQTQVKRHRLCSLVRARPANHGTSSSGLSIGIVGGHIFHLVARLYWSGATASTASGWTNFPLVAPSPMTIRTTHHRLLALPPTASWASHHPGA